MLKKKENKKKKKRKKNDFYEKKISIFISSSGDLFNLGDSFIFQRPGFFRILWDSLGFSSKQKGFNK